MIISAAKILLEKKVQPISRVEKNKGYLTGRHANCVIIFYRHGHLKVISYDHRQDFYIMYTDINENINWLGFLIITSMKKGRITIRPLERLSDYMVTDVVRFPL